MNSKYYKILGLPEGASINEIKKAYKKMALKHHPDINSKDSAHSDFLKIQEAYEVLTGKRRSFKTTSNTSGRRQETTRKRPPEYARKQQAEKESEGSKHFNNLFIINYLFSINIFIVS